MKSLIAFSFIFFSFIGLHAAPETCNLDAMEGCTAEQVLLACGVHTVGVDPTSTSNDKAGIRAWVTSVAQVMITLGGLFAVGALVWAGIQYTKAFGGDEKLKKAKTTGIYAIIGLFLVMGSFGLVDIFINFMYRLAGG